MDTRDTFRVGPIRPPSEADSLLLQVTQGCTWNRCRFCTIYKHTEFKAFSADSVKRDIDVIRAYADQAGRFRSASGSWDIDGINAYMEHMTGEEQRQCFYMVANWLIKGGENVFLQDGNTTALSSGRLSDVLRYLKQAFPNIKRITSYGRAENLSRYDGDYFRELKEAGLDRIHSGFESGSDRVLELINKGTTSEQEISAGKAIREGGIELSVYFMPGIGGKDLSQDNAEGTARVINEIDPDYLRIRTAAVKPGTELYEMYREGSYCLCSDDDKVKEIRRVLELSDNISTYFVSDHMVNLLQEVEGPAKEKAKMLEKIDEYLAMDEIDRRVFQLLRRSLRIYDLSDMKRLSPLHMSMLKGSVAADEAEWNDRMNEYICRYI